MFKTIRRTAFSLTAAAGLAVAMTACDSPTGLGSGTLNLYLTDAPGDVLSAVVTIDRIYLQADSNDASGRIILREDDVTTDLLTLVDSTHALIEDVEIPAGRYGQLRFVISGAYIVVEGEGGATEIYASSPTYAALPADAVVTGSLQMPSFATSGLKVNLPGNALVVADDGTVSLVVDFDVAQSFGKLAGASGRWVMSPVLRGFPPTTAP
ncbi:MAG: hypothetical protein C0503_01860 [Gemmatimonas sp.]|nr:hypothetical protein [Gemmatimonas sp.]